MAIQSNVPGALPLASTALYVVGEETGVLEWKPLKSVPDGFYKESHLFCYLPLPVTTELPVHINGSFAILSNRRQLSSKTTDDKNDMENQWNEVLLADAVTNAYIHMIESLERFDIHCENYFKLWPSISTKIQNPSVDAIYSTFYRNVINNDNKVFSREQKWVSVSNSVFLDFKFLMSDIEKIVVDATIKYMEKDGNILIKLEKQTVKNFKHVCRDLPKEIEARIISIENFFKNVFLKNIHDPFWADQVASIVLFALDNQDEGMKSIMQETACIPTRPNGTFRKPCELVKSKGTLADLFGEDDERFVPTEFENSFRLKKLQSMGMMVYKIREEVLLERMHSVQKIASFCVCCSLQRCKSILQYMLRNIKETDSCQKERENIPFLPVLCKPSEWELPWHSDNQNSVIYDKKCEKHESESISFALAKPSELFQEDCINLVGCQNLLLDVPLLKISYYDRYVLTKIGVRGKENVQMEAVISQLLQLSNSVNPSLLPDNDKEHLRKVCMDIYNFFEKVCQADEFQNILTLQNEPCLLIDDVFVRPKQVAISIPIDCSPALYGLGRISWSRNTHFLEQIGVKREFDIEDILLALSEMSEQYRNTEKLEQTSLELACKLVEFLAKKLRANLQCKDLSELRIPDENGCLSLISELCLNDSTLLKKGKHLKYPNENIKEADAKVLGVQSKIKGSLKDYIKNLLPFGQKEELTDRITRILSQYPKSEGMLKEMLQNADDAKATEVMFISDFNSYETKNTFGEEWHPLQGPALLVYNNSYFTENDIAGIQHLGRGSKEDDPTKTGQYGVGFNAVYHITDVPSFISKAPDEEETFCVMDPLCRYAPGASEYSPGARFSDLHELRKPFADVFKCYHEHLLVENCGTVFRLPLRSQTSELSDKIVTKDIILDMLETFKSEMSQCLLFLKSVRKISIATIKEEKIEVLCSSELSISENQEGKLEFDKYVREKASSFRENRELFTSEVKEVAYNVTLKDASNHENKWLLVQRFGISNDICVPKSVKEAIEDKTLGLLPQGGIAMPLRLEHGALSDAKAFCFLPLPCTTGLSVHINGHFSLDNESRRGLWNDDKKMEYRTQWNYLILSDIIAPIYAKAIEVQCKAIEGIGNSKSKDWNLKQQLKHFHSFFPNFDKACDHYWKHLTTNVYRKISDLGLKVFLSCHTRDRDQVKLHSYSLPKNSNSLDEVVFNVEYQKDGDEDKNITEISKDLGMPLVDTPVWICSCLEKASLKFDQLSPTVLTTFLKTKHCELHSLLECKTLVQLHETPFRHLANLFICITFCQKSEDFQSEVDGLPLCLLETGVLHKFSQKSPVIKTSFYEVLPSSFSKMLHHGLHGCFLSDESGCVVSLDIESFVNLLPDDLDYEKYRHTNVQWNPKQMDIPNGNWVESVWDFLHHAVQDIHDQGDLVRLLHPVMPWSLIPTKQTSIAKVLGRYEETVQTLFPVENSKHIIELDSFQPDMKAVLKKLNLPLLENQYINGSCPLRQLIASRERITDVLECLYFHRQSISENDTLHADECDKILEYFAGGLEILLSSTDGRRCVDMLRALPLFRTIHDTKINLLENRHILVLPSKLPSEGMNEWADRTRIILLHRNNRLDEIFKLFSVTEQSLCEFYRVHILPTFHNIPRDDRIKHLAFIRDELLKSSGNYTEDQEKLIRDLKYLEFVPTQREKSETASKFYSPFNKVMKTMLEGEKEKFPPLPFCKTEWEQFMILAGMISEITPTLFMRFAKMLEEESKLNLLDQDKLEMRSKCLVNHLLNDKNLHQYTYLQDVGKVKFVYPHKVQNFYCNIAPPANDKESTLVSFHGSVTSNSEALVWTKCFIVPEWAAPLSFLLEDKLEIHVQLGLQKPSVDTVIEHIKTVCMNLSKLSEPQLNSMRVEKVSTLMKRFYKYLSDKIEHPKVQDLRKIPIVLVSRYPKLFKCEIFTVALNKENTLAPYIMPLPEDLYAYHALFKKLGSSVEISYKTYADVLERIFVEGNDDLHPNELRIALIAMEQFFSQMPSDSETKRTVHLDLKRLYLLSSENKLTESNKLFFSDSEDIDKALEKSSVHFDFLASLKGMDREKTFRSLNLLPEKFRPLFLSQIVRSEANLTDVQEIESDVSGKVTAFLNSPEFTNGIVRLICKERKIKEKEMPTDEEINTMKQKLQRIRILFVENLETVYTYNSTVICRMPKSTHMDCDENNETFHCTMYARPNRHKDVSEWLQFHVYEIVKIIQLCSGTSFYYTSTLIATMCKCMKHPNTIKKMLDEHDILALDIKYRPSTNQLPVTGTFVEEKWLTILDNKGLVFEQGDYVAVLVGVDSRGNREFIYATIKEKLQSTADQDHFSEDIYTEYLVQIAPNKTKIFKAFDLFRFNRSIFSDECKHSIPRPLVDNRALEYIFGEIESTLRRAYSTSFPLEERVRICRRLMFQWHPDKNPDDVERATQVFKFIRTNIQNLEDEEERQNASKVNIPEDPPPQPAKNIFDDFDKCINRDKNIQNKPPQKASNPPEANRWLEQAKHDMKFAIQSISTDGHYNWICYICHQAAEKSLTAWQYFDDSKEVSNSENLYNLTYQCPKDLKCLARELQDLTGSVRRMRYPENRHKPWNSYTKENAEKAIELATAIMDKVDEII